MIDSRKFITGFLVLAVLVSSAVLIFSPSGKNNPASQNAQLSQSSKNSGTIAPIGENAFIESVSDLKQSNSSAITNNETVPPVVLSDNLTENFAQQLTRQVVQANPSDVTSLTNQISSLPNDPNDLVGQVLNPEKVREEIAKSTSQIEKESKDFKIKKSSQASDLIRYQDELNAVLNKNFVASGAANLLGDDLSLQGAKAIQLVISQSLNDLKEVSVPELAVNFHQSLIKLLAYERDAITTAQNESDPLRASLILAAQESEYNSVVLNFRTELEKIQSVSISRLPASDSTFAALGSVLGIKTAHAFLGIGDIVSDLTNLARMVWEWAKKFLVESLKNRLIKMMVNQTISWLKGGGKPLYVTDWKSFVTKAADQAAGDVIYKIAPNLCSNFGPLVTLSLTSLRPFSDRVQCTLSEVVNNLEAFYERFENGSWVDYATLTRPENNFFTASIDIHDEVLKQKGTSAAAAGSEAQSGQGLIPTKVCTKPQEIKIPSNLIPVGNESGAIATAESYGMEYLSEYGMSSDGQGNTVFKACPADGWETTTPGGAVAHTLYNSLDAPLARIVNAEDITGLVAAFVDSALNKLLLAGSKGLASLIGRDAGGVQPPVNIYSGCDQYAVTSTEYDDCIALAHEIASSSTPIILSKDELLEVANAYKSILLSIINEDNEWLASNDATIAVFRQVAALQCDKPNATPTAMDIAESSVYIAALSIKQEIRDASTSIMIIDDFIERVQNTDPNDTATLGELTIELEERFNLTFVNLTYSTAVDRNNSRETSVEEWLELIGRACLYNAGEDDNWCYTSDAEDIQNAMCGF